MRGTHWARGPHVGWGIGQTETGEEVAIEATSSLVVHGGNKRRTPGRRSDPGSFPPSSESPFNQPSMGRPARRSARCTK